MRFVSFRVGDRPGWGVLDDEGVVDLSGGAHPRLRDGLDAGGIDALVEAAAADGPRLDPDRIVFEPPVPDPRRILCIGVNYRAHRDETGRGDTEHPTVFVRFPSSLVGHGQPLVKPRETRRYDYEGELAVVIGRAGRRIDPADAPAHIAGWTCFMDGSARDFQFATSQFTAGKNFDRSGAMGPWLVDAATFGDPSRSRVRTRVNGRTLQDATTDLLIDDVSRLIAHCSVFTTLEPGDVIATGTPGGVGDRRDPPVHLWPGDRVEVEVDGIGVLANEVIEG
ncbi:MAG: FAA hydrolase family protein [Actinomyces sp.]|nr:MAG: FAA hydrolase family protein [Actinomyces sp.]